MILRDKSDYNTAMVGKWHLGHSQQKMTPTGRGFNSFTGMYMWDCDYETKQMSENVFRKPMMIDWVKEYANGTYHHYAEPLHSTLAITRDSEEIISHHATHHPDQPLFLYVPYTAAHSPLQPLPQHEAKCSHIPHMWRRQFCGLVVGFDEGVGNITRHAREVLGENLLVIVTSDNGGSPWFGGLNYPLKGAKGTPYEGGVKVPGLIVDYTASQRYLSSFGVANNTSTSVHHHALKSSFGERTYNGMMHFSDWLPTLLSYANVPTTHFPSRLDGYDVKPHLQSFTPPVTPTTTAVVIDKSSQVIETSPRSEMLLEYADAAFSVFNETLVAYRWGKYKFISGITRDEHYYHEAQSDWMNYTMTNNNTVKQEAVDWFGRFIEKLVRLGDWVFGEGRFDGTRISLIHVMMQNRWSREHKKWLLMTSSAASKEAEAEADERLLTPQNHPFARLYDLETDPYETTNLAYDSHPTIQEALKVIQSRLEDIRTQVIQRPVQKVYLQYHLRDTFAHTFVPGNCSMNPHIKSPEDCVFTHPWIPNDVNPWTYQQDKIINVNDFVSQEMHSLLLKGALLGLIFPVLIGFVWWWYGSKRCGSRHQKSTKKHD